MLEPEVPVETPGVVLLDDEPRLARRDVARGGAGAGSGVFAKSRFVRYSWSGSFARASRHAARRYAATGS